MAEYTEAFRRRMVERMSPPGAMSATKLSAEVGVSQATLSRWLRDAATVSDMARSKAKSSTPKTPKTPAVAAPASSWSAADKVALVLEAAAVPQAELGAWLRAKGLHDDELARLREEVRNAAVAGLSPKRAKGPSGEQKRIKELERELGRSKAALAETAALLVLRKKAVALWGEEGDDT